MAEIDSASVDAQTPETPEVTNLECTEENTSIKDSEDDVPETPKNVEEVMDTGGSGLSNYELRWNDHIPYFTTVFQSLREMNELTDVTFACEDGVVGAHKLVLSSCSPYLRALFARLAVPHPVIFLRNTPRALVHHLMEFVYSGIVSVPEGQLAMVLNLGHSLQIQGLTMLKLSRENEDSSATDEVADEIGSEPQLLPGEIRPTPNYALHNGEETEYDSESNKIERAKVFKKAKIRKEAEKDGNSNNSLFKKNLEELKKRKKLKVLSNAKEGSPNQNDMYKPTEYRVLGAYAEKYGEAAAMKFASKRYDRKVGRKAIETAVRIFKRSRPAQAKEATSKLAELIMVES